MTGITARAAFVQVTNRDRRGRAQAALIAVGCDPHSIHVGGLAADGDVFKHCFTQHDQVVLVPEQPLGAMESPDVAPDRPVALFDEAQRVPERLELLPPRVEIVGSLPFRRALHCLAPAVMRGADAAGQRADTAMFGLPVLGVPLECVQCALDGLPSAVALDIVGGIAPPGRELPAQAREGSLAEGAWMLLPKRLECGDQSVRVAQTRQRPIDPAHPLFTLAEVRPAVLDDELQNGTGLLQARPRVVNPLCARALAAADLIARGLEFLPGQPMESMCDGFVRSYSKRHLPG